MCSITTVCWESERISEFSLSLSLSPAASLSYSSSPSPYQFTYLTCFYWVYFQRVNLHIFIQLFSCFRFVILTVAPNLLAHIFQFYRSPFYLQLLLSQYAQKYANIYTHINIYSSILRCPPIIFSFNFFFTLFLLLSERGRTQLVK